MSRKRPSGSPTAWSERRKAYKAAQKQVSNPGHPSPCNRKARRYHLTAAREAYLETMYGGEVPDES